MHDETFPKSKRLLKKRDFSFLKKNSFCYFGRSIYIHWRPTHNPKSRLGITVTKKYAKSHDRNLFKRYVREAFRKTSSKFEKTFDLNVRPKVSIEEISFDDILSDFTAFFEKLQKA